VNRDDFEARVLEMWMKTRIPLTRANLQYFTGASRKELNKHLDALTVEGTLEVDVGDDAEMVWTVPGATRALDGATTFEAHERKAAIRAEARQRVAAAAGRARGGQVSNAMALVRAAGSLERPPGKGDKSLAVGAGVSLFLGPLGWLYAGSFKETVPAAVAAVIAFKLLSAILPSFFLLPLLAIALPLSALVGGLYVYQHNRTGARASLFLDGDKPKPDDD
jgi:hypothetical protein